MARYFTRIEPDPKLAVGYVELLDAIRDYTAKGRIADAAAVRAVLADMWAEYERLGIRAAAKADSFVRNRIRQTQVRPDASGRLRSSIASHPLPSTFPAGAIGIADLDQLDRGATQAGPYWRAQEYGTTAHVGRVVPGYFQPGSARPDPAQFRAHPYFEPVQFQRGTPAMVIRRPLRARHFLRDGAAETVVWRAAQEARIQRTAVSRLLAI